ncbi:acyltransferase family protein [Prosthecobacter sp.]|uniref:acyltransferase family protein n=1 Tax=Prosthecobacter sp. TaxID=1965333 RepID=UPI003784C4BC
MPRLASFDAYRGIALFLIGLHELLLLDEVAARYPDSPVWQFIRFHTSHVPWTGCSLHDLLMPSFVFLMGVSMVFSLSARQARQARGDTRRQMTRHALWRALALILLGIFIRSLGRQMTLWTFDETLTQMGLAYLPVFALAFCGLRTRLLAFAAFLLLHWLIYALYPVLPPHADPTAWNTPAGWTHDFTGFYAHWNHNRNAGWAFDVWLLNHFPRTAPYVGWMGGYTTLNFIPTISSMILGLVAGTWIKNHDAPLRRLLIAGPACILTALVLHYGGVCPIVKHLWTPAWVFLSGGLCMLLLAAFHQLVDVHQHRRWAFLFIIIGMNPLAFYLLRHTLELWLAQTVERHLGSRYVLMFGPEMQSIMTGVPSLMFITLVMYWMHRRKIFLRL